MKKAIFLTILCCMLLTTSVFAVEIHNENAVVPVQPEVSGELQNTTTGEMVSLGASVNFDKSSRTFHYRLSSGGDISSNVASGMVTTDSVWVTLPTGVGATLYRDGVELTDADLMNIREPGGYVVGVINSGVMIQPLRFTIVNSVTGVLQEYRVPDQFSVSKVTLNGEEQSFNPFAVDLSREGNYEITYNLVPARTSYSINIAVDHTAPVLELAAVEDGVAKGPVSLADLEHGASIYIEQDGKQISYTDELTESGSYVVTVQDAAGNSNTYKFVIRVYFNISSMVFFIMTVVVIAALVIYILRSRKTLRVR